jgi:hypothetical protein
MYILVIKFPAERRLLSAEYRTLNPLLQLFLKPYFVVAVPVGERTYQMAKGMLVST